MGDRVFLDVGAHEGQTLAEVVKPQWAFDRIYAFEPMPRQLKVLEEGYRDCDQVYLRDYGLADKTAVLPVYGKNDGMEASLFAAKRDVDETFVTKCLFVRASQWFESNVAHEDTVICKLNCEGAEVTILNDLIDSGEIHKLDHVMIDFDIRKVTGEEHREPDVLERLWRVGFDRFSLSENVMVGETHQDRIAHWLGTL